MRLQRWRSAAISLMLVAGVVGLGVASTAPASLGAPAAVGGAAAQRHGVQATTVRRVSPLNASGHLRARYRPAKTGRGYCWTASFVNGRLYRCFRGNLIQDPCWKEAGRRAVVCLPVPWASRATRLRLTRALPPTARSGPSLWGLRLAGGVGVRCVVSMGAGGTVGRHPISYVCRRGWVLLGDHPDRSKPRWTMLTAKRVHGQYRFRGRKPLSTAWRPVLRR